MAGKIRTFQVRVVLHDADSIKTKRKYAFTINPIGRGRFRGLELE